MGSMRCIRGAMAFWLTALAAETRIRVAPTRPRARDTISPSSGRAPPSGARGGGEVEIGQDLPREDGWVSFEPAFLGVLETWGVVAVGVAARGEGTEGVRSRRSYLGAPGSGPADRWEGEVGSAAYSVRPLALSSGGVLLTAYQEAYKAPWHLELVTLVE